MRAKAIAVLAVIIVLVGGLALAYHERQLLAACRTLPQADDAQYDAAEEAFGLASKAYNAHSYSTASDLFDMAASKLGNIYQMAGAGPDDTAETLEAARAEAARSDFQLAAQIKQGALQTRLSLYRRKQHLSQRCHAILGAVGLR